MHLLQSHKKLVSRLLLFCVMSLMVLLPAVSAVPYAYAADGSADLADASKEIKEPQDDDAAKFGCYDGELGEHWFAGCSALFAYYVLKLFYTIAIGMGMLFNFAFVKLVVGMGETVNSLSGISVAWATLRDIGNIFLVFLLVYVGISTILGLSGYGYRRLLWKILLAALLVNFSITFTKVIIDVSNIAAIQMFDTFITDVQSNGYTAFTSTNCNTAAAGGTLTTTNDTNPCVTNGIAGAFWTKLSATSVFRGGSGDGSPGKEADELWRMFWAAVMGTVMFVILAFVFGATAFFLLTRFVILIFLIVISPIALIAWITGVSGSGSKWFHTLLNQSFFAPLILLMWWVAYKVMGDITVTPITPGASVTDPSTISTVMTFIIVSGFLIAGLIVAKSFGAHGSTAAINVGKRWSRKAALGVAGGAGAAGGWAASQTVGRWSHNAAKAHREASARRVATDENGKYIDTTVAGKWQQSKVGAKLNRGVQNVVKAGSEKQFAKTKSFKDRRETTKKAAETQQRGFDTENRKQEINSAIAEGNTSVISKASPNELLEHKDKLKEKPELLAGASHNTFEKITENKDGTFTDNEVRAFKESRDKHFADTDKFGTDEVKNEVNTTSPKNLAKHGKGFYERKDVAQNIDTKTMQGLVANGLSQEKREALRKTIETQHKEITDKHGSADTTESRIAGPDGQPARKKLDTAELSKEEKNIMALKKWFDDDNKMAV